MLTPCWCCPLSVCYADIISWLKRHSSCLDEAEGSSRALLEQVEDACDTELPDVSSIRRCTVFHAVKTSIARDVAVSAPTARGRSSKRSLTTACVAESIRQQLLAIIVTHGIFAQPFLHSIRSSLAVDWQCNRQFIDCAHKALYT
jgi:hypothetical protein